MEADAIIFEAPKKVRLRRLPIDAPTADEVVVDMLWSGVSAGTERLLWSGRMPSFPGMGYPLVPGYESVGRVVEAGADTDFTVGEVVFVPGAKCYGDGARAIFGGSCSRVTAAADRVRRIDGGLGDKGCLLALAATAYHAVVGGEAPDLIIGHGVLGRLVARLTLALGAEAPTVWEISDARMDGGRGYPVIRPEDDARRDYRAVCDVSGAKGVIDQVTPRLAKGGEVTLAGFYDAPISFAFPPAFMAEARIRVAAEWAAKDLKAVNGLIEKGLLSLEDLITDRASARAAPEAYMRAFEDPHCLKLVFDWRDLHDGSA